MSEEDLWAASRAVLKARRRGSCVVEFRGEGSRPPLFLLPGRDGVAAPFFQYTEYLGTDQPFYLLEPLPLELDRASPHLFRDLAERYLEAIRPFQAQGPYFLAGYCSGGVVAYEMARALSRRGERVGALILMDTVIPTHARLSRAVRRFVSPLRQRLLGTPPLHPPIRSSPFSRLARFPYRRQGRRLPRFLRYKSFEEALLDQRHYAPEPYEGGLVLFRSDLARRQARPGWGVDADLGWGRVAQGGVEICDIPGSHWDFRHQPDTVRAVALALRSRLDLALADPRTVSAPASS